ncbi:MAG TPA: type II toxin-antitoxin system VapC family toxin [Gemmataceae bacterium]|jgi:predicted nucleic acid-binding protein|nr:type II toxin-antitoxin system VapC family toxin [Gemmataceae bacterium]
MTRTYLLDTNHVGAAVRRVSQVRDKIQQAYHQGHRFGTSVPVLCELEIGFQLTAHPEEYRQRLTRLLKFVRIWPVEQEIAAVYGALYLTAKGKGRTLSQVDLMLAALAKIKNYTVLTADKDFVVFPKIRTENWT